MFLNPLAPRLFAWSADKAAVANLLKGTGSKIGPRGVDLYARLLHNPGHVAGALGMMANWDLTDLRRDLPGLNAKVLLIVGENDKAVPPRDAGVVAAEIPGAIVETIRRAGHLAHEERPEEVCRIIMSYAAAAGLIADAELEPDRCFSDFTHKQPPAGLELQFRLIVLIDTSSVSLC